MYRVISRFRAVAIRAEDELKQRDALRVARHVARLRGRAIGH
jgi:hypothetical protein